MEEIILNTYDGL